MDPIKKIYLGIQKEKLAAILKTKVPVQNIRASELSKCKLMTYFRLMGFIPAVSTDGMTAARLSDYGYDGDVLHDSTRKWMMDHGLKVGGIKFDAQGRQVETSFHKLTITHNGETFNISMRLDGTIKIDRFKHALEIKTLGWGKFRMIREVWQKTNSDAAVAAWIAENRKDFLFQTHACMKGENVNRAYLLLKDRSESAHGLHSFLDPEAIMGGPIIHFKDSIWTQVLNRCAVVRKAVRTATPPRQEFNAGSKDCKYCDFFHLCHGADRRAKLDLTPFQLHPQLGTRLHAEDLK